MGTGTNDTNETKTEQIETGLFGSIARVVLGGVEVVIGQLPWRQSRRVKQDFIKVFKEAGLEDMFKHLVSGAGGDGVGGADGANFIPLMAKHLEKLVLDLPEPVIQVLALYIMLAKENDYSTEDAVKKVLEEATEGEIISLAKAVFGLLASPLLELISSASAPIGALRTIMGGREKAEPALEGYAKWKADQDKAAMDEAIRKD